jgi:hypothetical protein
MMGKIKNYHPKYIMLGWLGGEFGLFASYIGECVGKLLTT